MHSRAHVHAHAHMHTHVRSSWQVGESGFDLVEIISQSKYLGVVMCTVQVVPIALIRWNKRRAAAEKAAKAAANAAAKAAAPKAAKSPKKAKAA